jgi:hypothetical protein
MLFQGSQKDISLIILTALLSRCSVVWQYYWKLESGLFRVGFLHFGNEQRDTTNDETMSSPCTATDYESRADFRPSAKTAGGLQAFAHMFCENRNTTSEISSLTRRQEHATCACQIIVIALSLPPDSRRRGLISARPVILVCRCADDSNSLLVCESCGRDH